MSQTDSQTLRNIRIIKSTVKMPMMDLPVQTPIVKLADREIMISPGSKISWDQEIIASSRVTDIVAPNLFHGAGMEKAAHTFPNAKLWGVKGFTSKKPQIQWAGTIDTNNWPYHEALSLIELKGMPGFNEVVFFHRESKTLIVTDLCFNMKANQIGARILQSLFGTYNHIAVSRLFTMYIKDKNAFRKSLAEIFETGFENIVLSHGENILGQGQDKLRLALQERGF